MVKHVTRTIKTFEIYASIVKAVDGKIETTDLSAITVEGRTVTENNALQFVQKKYGKKYQYIIRSIETSEKIYGVPFDVFMMNATIMTRVESTATTAPQTTELEATSPDESQTQE